MTKYSRTCTVNEGYRKFWSAISSGSSAIDMVAISHASVWKSVIKNYTLAYTHEQGECKVMATANFYIKMFAGSYDKSLYTFGNYPTDTLTGLRIIGCGRQGLSLLAFSELVSIFDIFIWLEIAAIISLVPVWIKLLWLKTSITANIISVLKVILEQGNPFPGSVVNKFRLRCLLVLLLLMGSIISNAYKNTNVYNMVSLQIGCL